MLDPVIDVLDFKRIILASMSVKRKQILRSLGLRFETLPLIYPDKLAVEDFSDLAKYATESALVKALHAAKNAENDTWKPDIVIGAVTLIDLDGKPFFKPLDEETAREYLENLSGKKHTVHTGMALVTPKETVKFHSSAIVQMAPLSKQTIEAYIRTREPLNNVGGYDILNKGASFIKRIEGDFYAIVGLPVNEFSRRLISILNNEKKRTAINIDTEEGPKKMAESEDSRINLSIKWNIEDRKSQGPSE